MGERVMMRTVDWLVFRPANTASPVGLPFQSSGTPIKKGSEDTPETDG